MTDGSEQEPEPSLPWDLLAGNCSLTYRKEKREAMVNKDQGAHGDFLLGGEGKRTYQAETLRVAEHKTTVILNRNKPPIALPGLEKTGSRPGPSAEKWGEDKVQLSIYVEEF